MALGFITNLLIARALLDSGGPGAYATATILISILASLPFADLGLGAGVVNATADWSVGRASLVTFRRSIIRTLVVLLASALAIATVSVLLLVTEAWGNLFGGFVQASDQQIVATVVGIGLGVSVPLGVGMRVLQGLQLVRVTLLCALAGAVCQLITVVVLAATSSSSLWYPLTALLNLLLANLLCSLFAIRSVRRVARDLLGTSGTHGETVWSHYGFLTAALPNLITLLGVAVSLQYDRVILAHVSNVGSVAEYSFLAQFVTPITSVVTMASLNLWGQYRRNAQTSLALFKRDVLLFLGVGAVAALAACILALALVRQVTGGAIELNPLSLLAAGSFMLAWAASRPATMFLSSPRGLWVQAICMVISAPVNISLTIALGGIVGAAGAYLASGFCVLIFTALLPSAYVLMHGTRRPDDSAISQAEAGQAARA